MQTTQSYIQEAGHREKEQINRYMIPLPVNILLTSA